MVKGSDSRGDVAAGHGILPTALGPPTIESQQRTLESLGRVIEYLLKRVGVLEKTRG
jgi:hypothetical protein